MYSEEDCCRSDGTYSLLSLGLMAFLGSHRQVNSEARWRNYVPLLHLEVVSSGIYGALVRDDPTSIHARSRITIHKESWRNTGEI